MSNLLRVFQRNKTVTHGKLGGFPTRIERLPGKITKLTVEVPTAVRWKAGQHSYVRMPRGVSNIFDNHPFTIASIPSTQEQQSNKMVFLIRAHRGFTGALERRAILCEEEQKMSSRPGLPSSPSFASASSGTTTTTAASSIHSVTSEKPKNTSTWTVDDVERSDTAATATTTTEIFATPTRTLGTIIDGPYGTYVPPLHRTFDTVVLVAAGTGITAALPYALDLSRQLRDGGAADGCSSSTAVQEVRLVWVIRDDAWIEWVRSEFESIVRTAGAGKIIVDVYVTGKKKAELPMQQQHLPALPTAPPSAVVAAHHDEMMMMQPLAISGTAAGRRAALSLFPSQCSSSATLSPLPPRPSEEVYVDVDVDEIKPQQQPGSSPPIHVATTTTTSISASTASSTRQLNIRYEGRPRMAALVPQLVNEAQGARAFVVGCGPEALKTELGNAVAGMQKDVFRGEMEKVVLHMETFGW